MIHPFIRLTNLIPEGWPQIFEEPLKIGKRKKKSEPEVEHTLSVNINM